jgi:hypothetical protein
LNKSHKAGLQPPWHAGVPAIRFDRIPAIHAAKLHSCRSPESPASGHARPRVATRDLARPQRCRQSGHLLPLACGRPCYPCSTLTHSNRPCAGPGRASAISSWPLQPSIKIQVHRSQAGTWFLTSDGSAGRASRPVVSAKVYFTITENRKT